jgi:hypothetical protein
MNILRFPATPIGVAEVRAQLTLRAPRNDSHQSVQPPSMMWATPVVNELSSLAR